MKTTLVLSAAILSASLLVPASADAATCESLSSAKLTNGAVTSAQSVAAGTFSAPGRGGRAGASDRRRSPVTAEDPATLACLLTPCGVPLRIGEGSRPVACRDRLVHHADQEFVGVPAAELRGGDVERD